MNKRDALVNLITSRPAEAPYHIDSWERTLALFSNRKQKLRYENDTRTIMMLSNIDTWLITETTPEDPAVTQLGEYTTFEETARRFVDELLGDITDEPTPTPAEPITWNHP
jgi:hypothetical protein